MEGRLTTPFQSVHFVLDANVIFQFWTSDHFLSPSLSSDIAMRPPFLPRKSGSSSSKQPSAAVVSAPPPHRRRFARGRLSPVESVGAPLRTVRNSQEPIMTTISPVRASVLIAGTFDDDDVRVCYDYETNKTKKASPLSHRSSSLPHLSEVSRDDEDDEDEEESGSFNSSSAVDAEEAHNRSVSAHDKLAAASSRTKAPPPEEALLKMLGALSEEDIEIAACSSYAYAKLSRSAQEGNCADPAALAESRHRAAMQMAARHWLAEKGDADLALKKMRNTLRERPKADGIRHCLENDDEEALGIRQRVRHYLGPQCRMFVRGYDPDGRAIFHFIATNAPRNADPTEGCNESYVACQG